MDRKNFRGFQGNNIGSKIKDFTENAFVLPVGGYFCTANIIIAPPGKTFVRKYFTNDGIPSQKNIFLKRIYF
jgi:hypothetical protein